MDGELSFDQHICQLTKKAFSKIAALFKSFSSGDPEVLTLAYKVYVAQFWNTVVKFGLHIYWNISMLLKMFNITSREGFLS